MPAFSAVEPRWLWESLSALGIGLLIGLEREHARVFPATVSGEGGERDPHAKGARTFALIALYGYGAALCGESIPGMPLVALCGLALVLAALHLRRAQNPEPAPLSGLAPSAQTPSTLQPHGEDVTTEVAALCTAVLGILVHIQLQAAVMLGILTTGILVAKPWVRGLITRLRRAELTGTLQLLVAVLVVLPVVPDRALHLPWVLSGLINPRSVVLFIVLIAGIGYGGYFMVRLLGPRRGLALTGAIGGLTSSTAVTLAMGERARVAPQLSGPAALASTLACVVMVVRVLGLTFVIHPPLGWRLLWPALAMGGAYLLTCGVLLLRQRATPAVTPEHSQLALENPFELAPALKFGLLFVAVLVVSRIAHSYLGTRGLYLAALLAGLADVDPVTLAAARLCRDGGEMLTVGVTTILVAIGSNTLAKTLMAFTSGGRTYGMRVLAGHGVALLAGGLVLLSLWLR